MHQLPALGLPINQKSQLDYCYLMLVFWFHAFKTLFRMIILRFHPLETRQKYVYIVVIYQLDAALLLWRDSPMKANRVEAKTRVKISLEAFSSIIKSLNRIELWWTQRSRPEAFPSVPSTLWIELCCKLQAALRFLQRISRPMRNYNERWRLFSNLLVIFFKKLSRTKSINNNGDDRLVFRKMKNIVVNQLLLKVH